MSLQIVGSPPGGDLPKCKPIADNAARLECLDRLAGSKKYHLSADGPVPFDMAKKAGRTALLDFRKFRGRGNSA
jgi:hypothetical protein